MALRDCSAQGKAQGDQYQSDSSRKKQGHLNRETPFRSRAWQSKLVRWQDQSRRASTTRLGYMEPLELLVGVFSGVTPAQARILSGTRGHLPTLLRAWYAA